jgi:2-dehydro-3-deoxyphosphogluconate aldolase / (4S)-4-hydroxy-2-oxoglutarate aldolase
MCRFGGTILFLCFTSQYQKRDMSNRPDAIAAIKAQRMLPLFYHSDKEVGIRAIEALYKAGIRTIEFTNRGAEAFGVFEYLKKQSSKDFPDLLLGIGTIKDVGAARSFIGIGADYIICPAMNPDVAEVTHKAGLQWIPGCMTPTEIAGAELNGAKLVKLFPGNLLGPEFVSAVKAVFSDLLFMPTGGVEAEESNLRGWFKSGVCAVGMGSKLVSKDLLDAKDYAGLEKKTKEAIELIKKI